MAYLTPQQIAEVAVEIGVKKSKLGSGQLLVLGFLAGAFIALGFLLDERVVGTLPASWGSLKSFLGASVFPVGLVLVVLAGAELVTGNMMTLPIAAFAKKISWAAVTRNLFYVSIGNFLGSIFVAYFFGHIVGLTEGDILKTTLAFAAGKYHYTFVKAFISAVGCNWLVTLAVWLSFGAEDFAGKIIGIWFPVMAFVAIGFQHVVANMFIIPAAIFAGHATWADWLYNFVPVYLGNLVGGGLFVGFAYYLVYLRKTTTMNKSLNQKGMAS